MSPNWQPDQQAGELTMAADVFGHVAWIRPLDDDERDELERQAAIRVLWPRGETFGFGRR